MLRHRAGEFSMAGVDRSREPTKVLPKLPPPVCVEFRRDGDLDGVVHAVENNAYVSVLAGCGAGKSTKVPQLLADAMNTLVVHTIPAHFSAKMVVTYVQSIGGRAQFVDDYADEFPDHGVLVMSNAYLMTKLLHDRARAVKTNKFVLYMDENHESDAWTAAARALAFELECVQTLVLATATSSPSANISVYLPAKFKDTEFSFVPTEQWSANDHGKPWGHANLDNNTIMCIDNQSARNRLAEQYQSHGMRVYQLDARSKFAEIEEALNAMVSRKPGVNVLFVDYAYRSSLTLLGIRTLIDSGEVMVPRVRKDGTPVLTYRRAYRGEIVQFINRVGRVKNELVKRYYPSDAKPVVCDLEPLEADAACLIIRMFGYKPPVDLTDSPFAVGDVPRDIPASLAGDVPLSSYKSEHMEPWVTGKPAVARHESDAPYAYELPKRVARHTSVRTVPDTPVVEVHPPLPTKGPVLCAIDGLSDIMETRRSSIVSTVETIESGETNNVNMYDKLGAVYKPPKRVASQVAERRSREQLAVVAAEQVKHQELIDLSDECKPPVPSKDVGFGATVDASFVREAAKRGGVSAMPTVEGESYYYDGMHEAPEHSSVFPHGYDSILRFVEGNPRAHSQLRMLDKPDKLFAIFVVLERHNLATSRIWAITRLVTELMSRYADQVQELVNPLAFQAAMDQVNEDQVKARLDLRACAAMFPMFIDHPLVPIDRTLDLEQRIMLEYMKKFEIASVGRDHDKVRAYQQLLDSKRVDTVAVKDRRRAILF